ncbi:peptide chain release factor 3 [Conexibacter sp. JD483]|uniref:peptide chain release factor 3 n=1 Tax=unclassified Conexibacter TaxID=2627773 RepID=UPI0027289E33|nr:MULTISPECIES: peptide chain release factor 3 [unclassified Conexibacter]MDO8185300.1 peptide chain release factor 3 [Conexibacter sp. CPCC 205706]MDO8198346.1 peptide chain release factor 3 [Conexibacter sp. CPCC 205762]MDR9370533.1 peptide chain release factor 3 [Conexibacter sp. JD483]
MSSTPLAPAAAGAIAAEAARRRTFAIISHPDAGKTTLTEKLLLYAGALHGEAGSVKARSGRREVTSDWMELERRRGISVSSTVLRFDYEGHVFNLLDTPGHKDFSEDTLRVLSAVDAAVMLIDAAKGVEPQTLRLFEVARARRIPLLTFVNKYDRPGMEPLEILDHLSKVLDLEAIPVNWPVGIPGAFEGVIDRRSRLFHRFTRTSGGATIAPEEILDASGASDDDQAWATAREELELLDAVDEEFDDAAFRSGQTTALFFGSAVSNFGVGPLLRALVDLAPAPSPRREIDAAGEPAGARALEQPFSGLVFKVQANMDPRHRDRIAFVRICSGRFERGMRVTNERTNRSLAMAHAHEVFGRERSLMEEAFPGDVVGIVGAADTRVGDTLYLDEPARFPAIPSLAPEFFMFVRNADVSRYKQFRRGLEQLDEEGVVHVLRREAAGDPVPVLAGVGRLQFDVAVNRMENEFNASVRLEEAPWNVARRTEPEDVPIVRQATGAEVLVRADGTHLAVFRSEFVLQRLERDHPEITLDRLLTR